MSLFTRRKARVRPLLTPRLTLIPITPAHIDAEELGNASLGALLAATVPDAWPPLHWEPHVRAMIAQQCSDLPHTLGFHRYVVLRDPPPARVIGCLGAFPKAVGEVEIGYSTLPGFQRRGFATEGAQALIDWLLQQESVTSVTAQTYSTLPESIKVMQRCGMVPDGLGDEPDTVRYRRTR